MLERTSSGVMASQLPPTELLVLPSTTIFGNFLLQTMTHKQNFETSTDMRTAGTIPVTPV